jgi:hypothetical protein
VSDAIEAIRDDVADKYETKLTGLTIDEALEAAVLGYRVRHDGMQAGSYIHYEFNGWRHEFSHDGKAGSSYAWTIDDEAKRASWNIFELKPPQLDSWGRPVQSAPDKWGRT